MSSVKGQLDYDRSRHLNYISTAAFGDSIFTYTVTTNAQYQPVGTLRSLLSVGTASGATGYNTLGGSSPTAPAGRILRVNGRKLFPGANPCSTITVSSGGTSGTSVSSTVSQLYSQMVGVIDVVTGLSGFIDPNDSLFAIYNVDKAIDFPNDGANPANAGHKGPSLYTAGNVTADLNIVTNNGAIGVDVAAGAAGTITSAAGITANTGNLTLTTGKIVLSSAITTSGASPQAAGSASAGTATLVAGAMVVNTTAITATSRVFLTRRGQSSGGMYLALGSIVVGTSFAVQSYNASNTAANTDVNVFDWLIIN